LIHIYIPNANYEVEKIKIAVDIIDNLSLKLNAMEKETGDEYSISKEDITDITEEYRVFGLQKIQMLDTIRMVNKQLVDKLEEIQLPKIKKFLMKLGNVENDNDFKCTFCNSWSGKNKASLGAHMRNCKFNPKNKNAEIGDVVLSDQESTEPLDLYINTIVTENVQKKTKTKKV
jgi:hypothetical protein